MIFHITTEQEYAMRRHVFRVNYEKRIYEFDPSTIFIFYSFHYNKNISMKKLLKVKSNLGRCEVEGWNLRPICSPEFLNELGFQLQAQIEDIIGIKKLHEIKGLHFTFNPFYTLWDIEGIHYFMQIENGINYSYFQCEISFGSVLDINPTETMFWARVYSLKRPDIPVNTMESVTSEDVRFEICKHIPEYVPPMSEWPDDVLERHYKMREIGMGFAINYEKRTFIPDYWQKELKAVIETVLEKNRKAEERAKRKAEKEKKKIPVEYPAEILYWPDIIYHLTMNGDVTEDTVDEITDVISEYFESLKGEKPEFFSVDKVSENICDITVDFGMSPVKTLKGVVKAIEKAGINIEKIVIEG